MQERTIRKKPSGVHRPEAVRSHNPRPVELRPTPELDPERAAIASEEGPEPQESNLCDFTWTFCYTVGRSLRTFEFHVVDMSQREATKLRFTLDLARVYTQVRRRRLGTHRIKELRILCSRFVNEYEPDRLTNAALARRYRVPTAQIRRLLASFNAFRNRTHTDQRYFRLVRRPRTKLHKT